MEYLIGIDVGTSATKTVLFDKKGNIIASASREYYGQSASDRLDSGEDLMGEKSRAGEL